MSFVDGKQKKWNNKKRKTKKTCSKKFIVFNSTGDFFVSHPFFSFEDECLSFLFSSVNCVLRVFVFFFRFHFMLIVDFWKLNIFQVESRLKRILFSFVFVSIRTWARFYLPHLNVKTDLNKNRNVLQAKQYFSKRKKNKQRKLKRRYLYGLCNYWTNHKCSKTG